MPEDLRLRPLPALDLRPGCRRYEGRGRKRGGSGVGESAGGIECWRRAAEWTKDTGVEPGPGYRLQLDLDWGLGLVNAAQCDYADPRLWLRALQ